MQIGYIKLHRQLLEWEWYDDVNTFRLFTHLLLKANYEVKKWHGIEIAIGQFLTSRETLAKQTGLTEQQVRTALTKLKSTNEITSQSTNNYTLITISNWNKWQQNNQPNTEPTTNQQQTDNQPSTTTKEVKKERKKESNSRGTRFALQHPPVEWVAYCELTRPDLNALEVFAGFRDYWIAKAGKDGIKLDWLATWRNWIRNQKQTGVKNYGNAVTKSKSQIGIEGLAAAKAKRLARTTGQTGQHVDGLLYTPEDVRTST